ncbi:hypothetical protein B5F77_07525 [Parabacteroides sp. An277]|uniref:hypothetical protein n=1 Tax=Parabacteroides sp. An277 TaxID=1965619 RepID=UPI000B3A1B08|nr:hypothetical protein [Parabacteroides sp. An277]OUO52723.1 hypothetical protein B5F77_07525 [Parabacteroides sp. An277]
MGKFAEQQELQKENKEKLKVGREKLGSFFYDLAKIAFTSLVAGGIVTMISGQQKPVLWGIVALGISATYVFAQIGNNIIKQ